jgi:hypothetical protein
MVNVLGVDAPGGVAPDAAVNMPACAMTSVGKERLNPTGIIVDEKVTVHESLPTVLENEVC